MGNYALVKRLLIRQRINASNAIPTHCQNEIGNGLCDGRSGLSIEEVSVIVNSANTPA
jgi:hypothetical protein